MQVGHTQIILLNRGSLEIHLNITVLGVILITSVNSPQVTRKKFLIDIDVVYCHNRGLSILGIVLNRGYKSSAQCKSVVSAFFFWSFCRRSHFMLKIPLFFLVF